MSSNTTLILLITSVIITVGGILILYDFTQNAVNTPGKIFEGITKEQKQGDELTFVNVVGRDPSGKNYTGVRFQVKYTGDGPLPLDQTYIQIKTPDSTADLHYRNGTLVNDPAVGYYTN